MRLTQLARVGICTAVAAAAVPTLGVGPANACSCAPRTDEQLLRDANAVFTGTLVQTEDGPTPTPVGAGVPSGHSVTYTFAVDRVYKGAITERQRVTSGSDEAPCGFPVRGDGLYVVFANRAVESKPRDQEPSLSAIPLSTGLCNGSRKLEASTALPFGRGRAPAAPAATPTATPTSDAPDFLGPTTDDEDEGNNSGTAAAVGVAAALIAGGLVLRRRAGGR